MTSAVRLSIAGNRTATTAVGIAVDARGNTVTMMEGGEPSGSGGAPNATAAVVGFFFNASHGTAAPLYAYCFPIIASLPSLGNGFEKAVRVAISRVGSSSSSSAAEGAIEGQPAQRQRWVEWRVNASYSRDGGGGAGTAPPSQGLPLECALADYHFALPNTALLTRTASAPHSPTLSRRRSPFSASVSFTSIATASSTPSSSAAAEYFTDTSTGTVSDTCTNATTNASRSDAEDTAKSKTKTKSRSKARRRPPRVRGVPFVDHPIVFKSNHRRRSP